MKLTDAYKVKSLSIQFPLSEMSVKGNSGGRGKISRTLSGRTACTLGRKAKQSPHITLRTCRKGKDGVLLCTPFYCVALIAQT